MLGTLSRLFPFPRRAAMPADLVWYTGEVAQSTRFASRQAGALAGLAIGAVLDLRPGARHELATLGKAGLHYLHLPVDGNGAPTPDELTRAGSWAMQELEDDRKLLVHCAADSARGLAIAAGLLVRMGYPLADAVALVRQRHPETRLDDAQLLALQRYAQSVGASETGSEA